MCIIAVKPAGAEMVTEETIRTMFEKNAHGAGYMIQRAGQDVIHIRKGFATIQHLLANLKEVAVQKDDIIVMHFRIATSGGIKKEMCHPFVVHKAAKKANAISIATNLTCFAHNGIISDLNGKSKEFSDTSLFAMHYLSDPLIKDNLYESAVIQEMVEKFVDNSRLVFLHPTKGILLLGTWVDDNGIHYSNSGYKKYVYQNTYNWEDDKDFNAAWTKEYYNRGGNQAGNTNTTGQHTPIGFKTPEQKEAEQIDALSKSFENELLKDTAKEKEETKIYPLSKIVEQGNFTPKRNAPEHTTFDNCTYCGTYKEIFHEAQGEGYSSCLCKGCWDTLSE